MQKRPNSYPPVRYEHYYLDDSFPVENSACHSPSSEEVTYLHVHNCFEIGKCIEGAGVFFVDNKILPFKQGDVCLIFKNQIHIAQSEKDNPSRWKFMYMHPDRLLTDINIKYLSLSIQLNQGSSDFVNILSPQESPEITQLVSMIFDEIDKKETNFKASIRGLVWSLSVYLGRMLKTSDEICEANDKNDMHRIAPALEYILNNYMNNLNVKSLALMCNMSVTNFRRIFNACMDISPLEYIVNVRIQMAAVILKHTDSLILDVALKVGYTSLSSFNRHFKRIHGISPREWKKGSVK